MLHYTRHNMYLMALSYLTQKLVARKHIQPQKSVKLLEGIGDRQTQWAKRLHHWIRMGIYHNSSKEWKMFVIKCQACMLFIFE